MSRRGWKETDSEFEANLNWADKEWISKKMDYFHFNNNQMVNHFRNHFELSKKDFLAKNIKKFKKKLTKEGNKDISRIFDFLPLTFNLPIDYAIFVQEFNKNPNRLWIMKPVFFNSTNSLFVRIFLFF